MTNNDQNKRVSKRNISSKDPFILIRNLTNYKDRDRPIIFEELAVPASKIGCFGKSAYGYFVEMYNTTYFVDKIEYDKIQTWLSTLYMVFK